MYLMYYVYDQRKKKLNYFVKGINYKRTTATTTKMNIKHFCRYFSPEALIFI